MANDHSLNYTKSHISRRAEDGYEGVSRSTVLEEEMFSECLRSFLEKYSGVLIAATH